jgi:rod shape-determining protein MreB
LLKGLPKLIAKETGVPVILAEKPLECVAIGSGTYFETMMNSRESSDSVYESLNL